MDWFVLVDLLRTLVGILDDYFDGYYTEEMIESQVVFIMIFLVTITCGFCLSLYFYVHSMPDRPTFQMGVFSVV